jgi:hypothetical protein
MHELIRNQRLSGGVIYNDAKACYDRIIENLSNLAFLQHVLPLPIAQLHTKTFKLGISSNSHKYNQPAPVYGVGQGACDAPACWGFICDALIEVYKSLGTNAIIPSSISKVLTNLKISAFVNDTALLSIISRNLSHCIPFFLQSDTQLWDWLLFTSGGKLDIPKCNFSIFN